ncbi:MAG TPA: hypothetical protein VKA69_00050 [Desulfobacteria bacterium]|nr:hypothetical protein [Desulfobacteria bacterium]
MNGEADYKTDGIGLRNKIKALLVQQFLLHETEHHPFNVSQNGGAIPEKPRAHDLIDIYKCLHQGEFGVAHTVDDPDRFRDRLHHELLRIRPASDEPVLENVSIDGSIMRVNLRPYRALFAEDTHKACDLLTGACLESAAIPKGNSDRFLTVLYGFRDLNKTGELVAGNIVYAFPSEMVDRFFKEVSDLARRLGEIPVFSHSPVYRRLNSPSYRVVDLSVIQQSALAFMLNRHDEHLM